MKVSVVCDYCGCVFERESCYLNGKKHHFCSRKCLGDFSSKTKNPEGYKELKDYTNIGSIFTRTNAVRNKSRMTKEVRTKIRLARLNTGEGKTYTKLYGRHEHRVVAEKMIGRPLKSGEIVHHRDGNKRNNNPNNLVVFSSQSEHARFHAELDWFLKELEKLDGGDDE